MKIKRIARIILIEITTILILGISTNVYAANNMAFSAGKGYGDVDMSATTIKAYTSYKNMGYNSNYATSNSNYNTLAGKFSNGTKRLESDIVFLTGHGMWSCINTLAGAGVRIGTKQGNTYVGTDDITWNKVKLAIFLACGTGEETNNSEINLAYNVFKKSNWSTTSIGWRQTIDTNSADKWIGYFNSKLESGATVSSALNYANSKNYPNNSIKDIAFYGNQSLKLNSNNNILIASNSDKRTNEVDERNITYIKDNIKFDGTEEELSNIVNFIKKDNKDFNIDDYKVNIYTLSKENKYYTIDFIYTIDDIYTNSAYTVIVDNGKAVQLADNTVEFSKEKLDTEFDESKNWVAKKFAESQTNKENVINCIRNMTTIEPVKIIEQKTMKYIDLKTQKKYIKVYTTYSYINSESKAMIESSYEI